MQIKVVVGFAVAAALSCASARAGESVLGSLMSFHPGWITRTVTSHDQWGGNGDGSGDGIARETRDGAEYHTLFHGKGEGRINRLWMTVPDDRIAADWLELWIEVDGQTVFRGKPLDFFEGRGPWQAPLVLGYQASSGGYLSYVPFSYTREARILLKGDPHYFQVTYREGPGSSAGPDAADVTKFLSETWNDAVKTVPGTVVAGRPLVLARGPFSVERLTLDAPHPEHLFVRIGTQPRVPAGFFFGLATDFAPDKDNGDGWATFTSALNSVDASLHRLATRLPIPLQAGESLVLETDSTTPVAVATEAKLGAVVAGVHLRAQFREQDGPGIETTMPFYVSTEPTQFVSLVERISKGAAGSREYLEGDEMVRTDGLDYPFELGTGTEDYFNGGWYFLGPHGNPLSGQPRFIVHDPEDGWSHARFEHSLYRHHLLDPVVGREGVRFGFEAGDTGAFTPVHYTTLAFAYGFDNLRRVSTQAVEPPAGSRVVTSALDAERNQAAKSFAVSDSAWSVKLTCPATPVNGLFLSRTYDAAVGDQDATALVNGRTVGRLFEAYANPDRRLAQDSLWMDLLPSDCSPGRPLVIEWSSPSATFNQGQVDAAFFVDSLNRVPAPKQGERVQILDTTHVGDDGLARADGKPWYVNDHTIIRGDDGLWHLYGIYHAEPANSALEIDFVHATHAPGEPGEWGSSSFLIDGIAYERDAAAGDTVAWAPHVVRDPKGGYVMVYHGGGQLNDNVHIGLARSADLSQFEHVATLFEDVCVSRDPMLRRSGDLWVLYYTRCDSVQAQHSGVAYRTSADLIHWSDPSMALTLGDDAKLFNSGYTESPFVFERDGWFYLSVTSYPIDYEATQLFRSRSPFYFPPTPIARLKAHAPEWLEDSAGKLFMTHAGWGQGGVFLMSVDGL
jgi:hypothetical protein